jgi:hypothetical protein
MAAGTAIVSPSDIYEALMQTDGNFVVYRLDTGIAQWATGTEGTDANQLAFQSGGDLVVSLGGGNENWDSGTNNYGGTTLNMQDDGNLVQYTASGRVTWSSWYGKVPPPTTAPTASLKGPKWVPGGSTPELTYSSTNASSCTISYNGIISHVTLNGSIVMPPTAGDTNYILNCTGPGGSVSKELKVSFLPGTILPTNYGPVYSANAGAPLNINGSLSIINSSATNWSGYEDDAPSGTYTKIKADVTVPAINCANFSQATIVGAWIGLDGARDGTVEQTGVDASCDNVNNDKQLTPDYFLWYEMYPAAKIPTLGNHVNSGDTIQLSIIYNSGDNSFTLTAYDTNTKYELTVNAQCPTSSSNNCLRSSAEFIVENHLSDNPPLYLSQFTNPITFSNAEVANNATNGQYYPFTDWVNTSEEGSNSQFGKVNTLSAQRLNAGTNSFSVYDNVPNY